MIGFFGVGAVECPGLSDLRTRHPAVVTLMTAWLPLLDVPSLTVTLYTRHQLLEILRLLCY